MDARELQGRPTGTGRYLRNLLREWVARGEDTLVAYFDGPPPADPLLHAPSLRTRALGPAAHGLLWQELLLPRVAAGDGLDAFFSPAYSCPLRLRVPRVTAVHDLSFFALPAEFRPLEGLRRRVLTGASIAASARVLACSEFTRREITRRFPDAAARVLHVPLGPDDDLPPPPSRSEARARLGAEGPLLVAVGSLFNRRRVPELLQAVALLTASFPALALRVVGENRTHPRRGFASLAARLGVARHVRFEGFVSEAALADLYAGADLAVCLSEYEGFGLPALEAMSRGVPVLAADRPSLNEVFGEAARLVDPDDPAAVAAEIGRLLRDAALREDLVARGRLLARRHSWCATAERTRGALQEAATRP